MAAPTNQPPPPSSASAARVSSETVEKAVKALLQWGKTKSESEKPQLLEEDEFLYLILTLKKIPPKGRTNPYKIPLPNDLHAAAAELCLIMDDRPKSGLSKDDAKKKIKAENIPISKVIKLTKLKTDYRPFEAKRKLGDSYDMFFADKRIVPLLPKLLGKHFFKKKKIPVPVNLKHKNWKEQIERACGSAMLFVNSGTCSVLKVGRVSMTEEEMVENVMAAIEGVAEVVPKNWSNVRSFHVKLPGSLALPVYQTVPDVKLKIDGLKAIEEVKEGGDEDLSEKSDSEKVGKKKSSKKGHRIHEFQYMDSIDGDADELAVDELEMGDGKNSEGDELGSGGKKRKKEGKAKSKKENGSAKAKKDESDDDVLEMGDGEDSEDDEKSNVGKKRKKEGKALSTKAKKDSVVAAKGGEESVGKKKDAVKAKKEESVLKGGEEESGGKKENKKNSIKGLKDVEIKVKGKTKKRGLTAE